MEALTNQEHQSHATALDRLRRPDAQGVYNLAVIAGGHDEKGRRALAALNEAGVPVIGALCSVVDSTEHGKWTRYGRVMRAKVGAARALGSMKAATAVPAMCRAMVWGGWLEYLSLGGEPFEWADFDPYQFTEGVGGEAGQGRGAKWDGFPKSEHIQFDYGSYYAELEAAVLNCGDPAVKQVVNARKRYPGPPVMQGMRFYADVRRMEDRLLEQYGPEQFMAAMTADLNARNYVLQLFLRTGDKRAVAGLIAKLADEQQGSGYDIAYVLLYMRANEAEKALEAFDEREKHTLAATRKWLVQSGASRPREPAGRQAIYCYDYVVLRSDIETMRRLHARGNSYAVGIWCKYHGIPTSEIAVRGN